MNEEKMKEMLFHAVKLSINNEDKQQDPPQKDSEVLHTGQKIILPEDMTKKEAIKTLQRKLEQDEMDVAIREEIDAFPFDGAIAFMEVCKRRFGWINAEAQQTFFGPKPPTMLSVETDHGVSTQVLWGRFSIPGVEGQLATGGMRKPDGKLIFVLGGEVKQKHKQLIATLAQEARHYVREHSIYRGKGFKLRTDEKGEIDFNTPPAFIDLSRVDERELVLPIDTQRDVETNLFCPIEHTEACRKLGVPLKRGVLLEGPYGTGKTLTAFVTAKKCRTHGWTFIYLDRVTALKEAYMVARQYSPAVIFAEDIDRVASGERDVKVDDVLNNIDGIESKGSEIITILTTNDVRAIEPAMMRPGRLDAVISVLPPDADAAERLMRLYARSAIAVNEDLAPAAKELSGQIPAVIREVVERAKLYAISRNQSVDNLLGEDLLQSARSMKRHLELMKPEVKATAPTLDSAMQDAVRTVMNNGLLSTLKETQQTVNAIREYQEN